jgi:hypothetical protein
MRIPEIQERLFAIAQQTANPEIAALAQALSRRRPLKRAAITSEPMTDELRDRIRHMARSCPQLSQKQIADAHNVHSGRVSETLRGKRQ